MSKRTPQNGWIIFSGYNDYNEHIWRVIEPPLQVKRTYYYCDKRFRTELFSDLFDQHNEYRVFVIDSEHTKLYMWKNGQYTLTYKHDVDIANNSRRGGYSANRYRRIRENKKNLLFDTIVENIKASSIPLILCGYSEMMREINDKLLGVGVVAIDQIKIDSPHDTFDSTLIGKIKLTIATYESKDHYQALSIFEDTIVRNPDVCLFGFDEVKKNDDICLVKSIITSDANTTFKCKDVQVLPHIIMEKYNGSVGILYYPITME